MEQTDPAASLSVIEAAWPTMKKRLMADEVEFYGNLLAIARSLEADKSRLERDFKAEQRLVTETVRERDAARAELRVSENLREGQRANVVQAMEKEDVARRETMRARAEAEALRGAWDAKHGKSDRDLTLRMFAALSRPSQAAKCGPNRPWPHRFEGDKCADCGIPLASAAERSEADMGEKPGKAPTRPETTPHPTAGPLPENKPASGSFVKKPIPVSAVQQSEAFEVKTLEGTMYGGKGDWLLTGYKGEQWPVKDEIFRATYEPAAATPDAQTGECDGIGTMEVRSPGRGTIYFDPHCPACPSRKGGAK